MLDKKLKKREIKLILSDKLFKILLKYLFNQLVLFNKPFIIL